MSSRGRDGRDVAVVEMRLARGRDDEDVASVEVSSRDTN